MNIVSFVSFSNMTNIYTTVQKFRVTKIYVF